MSQRSSVKTAYWMLSLQPRKWSKFFSAVQYKSKNVLHYLFPHRTITNYSHLLFIGPIVQVNSVEVTFTAYYYQNDSVRGERKVLDPNSCYLWQPLIVNGSAHFTSHLQMYGNSLNNGKFRSMNMFKLFRPPLLCINEAFSQIPMTCIES